MASILLGVFALGFLCSHIFLSGFVEGLLSSISLAGLIGGLADWFAITGLFRKPLGITWPAPFFRTEVIPKNRERIFNELASMVQEDILSEKYLQHKINDIKIDELLVAYFEDLKNYEQFKDMLFKILADFFDTFNPKLWDTGAKIIMEEIENQEHLSLLLADFLENIITNKYDDELIEMIAIFGSNLSDSFRIRLLIGDLLEKVMVVYEKGMTRRKYMGRFLLNSMQGTRRISLSIAIQEKIKKYINDIKERQHPLRMRMKESMRKFIIELRTNKNRQDQVKDWMRVFLNANQLSILTFLESSRQRISQALVDLDDKGIRVNLSIQLDALRESFMINTHWREVCNDVIRKLLLSFVHEKHYEIGNLVKSKLSHFTKDMLVDLIENRAGNDLQIVRINGSVVGGIAGGVLYLFTFWIS